MHIYIYIYIYIYIDILSFINKKGKREHALQKGNPQL